MYLIFSYNFFKQEYIDSGGTKGHFTDSQFLVFVNRILAFVLSGLYIMFTRQPRHVAPLYKYVYCSFSNIMSSWCQYEALKYVSFPTQVRDTIGPLNL
jgi:adenosine 3'-phospho 5'-phosphosulfate transporter B2